MSEDTWSTAHDLALIYIALAYGTDYQLSDEELDTITSTLQGWRSDLDRESIQEVVVEAMTVFLEDDPEKEVVNSMQTLKQVLSSEDQQRVLREIMHIAEADGVLLRTERSLIAVLADLWEVRAAAENLVKQSTVSVESAPFWSLLHDMGLMYLVVSHSTDNNLETSEISAMVERMLQWEPTFSEDEARTLLREVLQFYAEGPDELALQRSVYTIRDTLPMLQRLALLDDLVYIAEADGDFTQHEKDMILTLSRAWNVAVRLNGKIPEA
jgi:uncharacterized tellurite resistance protein B-like protein